MVEITLVRHGQANTGAKDERSYDNLSDLGRRQAEWLGAYFADVDRGFDHIVSGSLNRQRDTAQVIAGALGGVVETDQRLNELDYFGLAHSLLETHAVEMPDTREAFVSHVPQVLSVWEAGQIHSDLESFADFEARVRGGIEDAQKLGGRVLMVTSGGVIGMAMRLMLGLETRAYANVLIQIYNSSFHRFVLTGDTLALDTFNAVPHLEGASRAHARTYV